MSNSFTYNPPEPTWRLCHPVNIYVYRNGLANIKPCLVHIPMEKKKNMTTVLEAIGIRMKLPVGYPVALYHMDGQRVCKTYELEMYNNYVVVTNMEKRFKCVDYGRVREPLVVIGPYSKHVNTLKMQNKKFDLFCRQKMHRKPLHELMANTGEQDGYGPSELPVKPCGALCHKVMPRRDRPTQCCSDEIMCVEGAAMDVEKDECRGAPQDPTLNRKCWNENRRASLNAPPGTQMNAEDCMMMEELQNQMMEQGRLVDDGQVAGPSRAAAAARGPGPLGMNENLVDLMTRYKNVGSDIFKLFQSKINKDMDQGSEVSSRWQIPGGSKMDLEAQQKVKQELMRLAEQSCQFTFDQYGNFVYSDECKVPGAQEGGNMKGDISPGTVNKAPQQGTSKRRSSGGDGVSQKSSTQPNQKGEGADGRSGNASSNKVVVEEKSVNIRESNNTVNMVDVIQVDEENNVSIGSIPGLTKTISSKYVTAEEGTEISQLNMEDVEEDMREMNQMAKEADQEQAAMLGDDEKQPGKRQSKMDSVITEIVGNMRRSLVMSRSNSLNRGALPLGVDSLPASPKAPLSAVTEEEEDGEGEGEINVKATISAASSNKSKGGKGKDDDDKGGNEGGGAGGEMNVLTLLMESRNPFKGGKFFPFVGKKKDQMDNKSFVENPIRDYWFHGEEKTPRVGEEKRGSIDHFLKCKQLSQEGFNCLLPPPPAAEKSNIDMSPIFSPRASKAEWWPQKKPDVFLQQINELIQRHDNTKATSPPPPLPPSESSSSDSTCTFTIGPSNQGSLVKMNKMSRSVGCEPRRTEQKISKSKKRSPRYRNVCAQVEPPPSEDEEVVEVEQQYKVEKEIHSSRWKRESDDYCRGGEQQQVNRVIEVQTIELPSEDEKPAGMYEGYQEPIKSEKEARSVSSENDEDAKRKLYYRKRRESKRQRRKRKEKYLHPCNNYYSAEEEDADDDDDVGIKERVYVPDNSVQEATGGIGCSYLQQQYSHLQPSSLFPRGIHPFQQPQQPVFVQTSSTTPTTLPFLARHSTQNPPTTLIKTVQGGLPFLLPQQYGGSGKSGYVVQAQVPTNRNNNASSTSPIIRQPLLLTTTTQSPQQNQQQQLQQTTKFLPVLQPQNTSVRLIKLVHPSQQILQSVPTATAGAGGPLQNKLVQMMTPGYHHPFVLSSSPHHQQIIQTQLQQPQQQFIFKQ